MLTSTVWGFLLSFLWYCTVVWEKTLSVNPETEALVWLCNWVNMGPPAHLLSASFYETDGPALWVLTTLINCIMIYGFYKNCISLLCKHFEYHARHKECLQTFVLKYLTGISPWSLFHDTEFRRSSNAWVIMEVNSRLTVSSQAIPPPFSL